MATYDILSDTEALQAVNGVNGGGDNAFEIGMMASAISTRIDTRCGPVVNRTITEVLDPHGCELWVTRPPIYSVTSVTEYVSGTGTVLAAETLTVAGDYLIETTSPILGSYILRRRNSFYDYWWLGRVSVVYVAGRAATTATVDPIFKTAAASILRRLWRREGAAWATAGNPFAADDGTPGVGFFRAVDPILNELLGDYIWRTG